MSGYDALDDFAGPGGWDEGAALIGLRTIGLEWDHDACRTAVAAGHARIRTDVATYPSEPFTGIPGLIASPPCTLFSAAGSGVGKRVLDVLTDGIVRIFAGDDPDAVREKTRTAIHPVTLAEAHTKNEKRAPEKRWTPERVEQKARADAVVAALVLEPARRIIDLDPEWVALEQVPEVLPLWHVYRRELRTLGYSVWTTILNAADYGVPQTRRRAVLGASRTRDTHPPEPTHTEHPQDADLFGDTLERWVSMGQALGWGMHPRPSVTLTAGSGRQGAGNPLDGGSGARRTVLRERTEGRWWERRPATTVVGSFRPDVIAAPGYRTQTSRQDAPDSVTVTVEEAGVLQSFRRDYPWCGSIAKQQEQAGNAVPPLLAAHVLAAITGRRRRSADGT